MTTKREIISDITSRIDVLESHYTNLINNGDTKATSGLERCIELLMRLHGIDGKTVLETPEERICNNNSVINVSDLSASALKELLVLAEKNLKTIKK